MRRTCLLIGLTALFIFCSTLMGGVPTRAQQATDIRVVSNSPEPESNHWITFTAFLTCGDALPTGKVTFFADSVQVATADIADGMALFGMTFTPGDHEIVAEYGGDSACGAGRGVMPQLVVAAFSMDVMTSVNPSTLGQAVTFTSHILCGLGAAGSVVFSSDGNPISGAISITLSDANHGTAQFTTSSLPAGTHTIQATYSGVCSLSASATTTQIVGGDTVTWCSLGTDGRLNSQCGDRIVLYCNANVTPANLDIWVIDDQSQGHDLTTIPLSLLSSVPAGQFVKGLGNKGVIFAGLDANGNGYAALEGGPYNATAKGDWSKTFVCKSS